MAKKKQVAKTAKVSQIPLPVSETPLVIDLPDGQKLVIGKMPHGSVIEVATWRGTGRPDSRTNRLMLGMSSGQVTEPTLESDSNGATNQSLVTRVMASMRSILSNIGYRWFKFGGKAKDQSLTHTAIGATEEPRENLDVTSDVEIDEWLAKITRKVEDDGKRKRPRKGR